MSPEQARSEKVLTVATDVWGLGAVLYELLTGKPAFDGSTAMAVLEQVRETEPPRPSLANPAVDRDLGIVCLKCLRKDPRERYHSAEALGRRSGTLAAGRADHGSAGNDLAAGGEMGAAAAGAGGFARR
jgi:serine/threonine-protein kinase